MQHGVTTAAAATTAATAATSAGDAASIALGSVAVPIQGSSSVMVSTPPSVAASFQAAIEGAVGGGSVAGSVGAAGSADPTPRVVHEGWLKKRGRTSNRLKAG